MAVENLHEAALVLQGAYQALEKLLAETEPMQRAHERHFARPLTNEELFALGDETGYKPFYDATEELLGLLGTVDDMEREEAHRRFSAA